jgi:enoyl-CoA hydratase/carnithine racemase
MKPILDLSVERDGPLAIVIFDEVQLKLALLTKLALCIYQLESDDSVRGIIITGRRNVFLGGADLKEFDLLTNRDIARKFIDIPVVLMEQISQCPKVVVAAINGYCIGGGLELALACDFRVCVDRVLNTSGEPVPFIGLPEVGLGVVSPLGSSYFLPRIVGLAHAKEVMLTADLMTAERALAIGMVHGVVPEAQLLAEARRWAGRAIKNSLFALRSAKQLLNRSYDQASVKEALLAEREAFAACCETPEKEERIGGKVRPRRASDEPLAERASR